MLGGGAGAGAVSWLQVVETGCWCWVPGAGAGASAVSWLCTWWRQVAGAGAGCRVPVHGAGAVSWLCTGCCELAVRVVETGRRRWVQQLCQGLYCLCAYFCTSQRQALNQPLFQHVSACYTHNSRAGYCWVLGK